MAITTRGTVILAVGSAVAVTATAAVIYQQRSQQEAVVEETAKAEDFVEEVEQVDATKVVDVEANDTPKEDEEVDATDVPVEESEVEKEKEGTEESEVATTDDAQGPSLTAQAPRPSAAKRASNAPEELKKWLSSWTKTPEEAPKDDTPEDEPTPEEASKDVVAEAEPTPEETPVNTEEVEPTAEEELKVETLEENAEPVESAVTEAAVVADEEEVEEETVEEEQPSPEEAPLPVVSNDEAPLNPEEIKEASEAVAEELVKDEAPLNPEEIKESVEARVEDEVSDKIQEGLDAMGIEFESPEGNIEPIKEVDSVPDLKQVETDTTEETSVSNSYSNSSVSTDLGASAKSQPVEDDATPKKKKKRSSISKVLGRMSGSSKRRISKKEYSKRWQEVQATSN